MTAERPPALSVIIAAYNAEATLAAQLHALRRERSALSFEVLICDNGSTDGTPELVRRMAPGAPSMRLIDASARRGPAAARNIGAETAVGEVLLFCDADDVIALGWVETMGKAAAAADLVAGRLEGRALNRGRRTSVSWEVSSEITVAYWPRYPAAATSNLAVRTSAFRAVGGFDEHLGTGEDVDLCWRIQRAGFSFARAPQAVVHSRQREGVRAVFRQSYSYAAGHRALRIKYARLIDAQPLPAAPPISAEDGAPPLPVEPLILRLRRAALSRAGQANLAWRLGELLGSRFGRVHPDVGPLAPD
ncbi:glycosyltransferase family 2 protein [Nesterenkonia sp. NBAIMH1]|uniref:glycosyltransferase n=1 Tax=Nesterenkonia sp. NBAIMH1 TaxID=2600320 RepID=UPI00143D5B1B|nr:glycosyltransferase [Nesterenkonia sp. NBAIMH1]